MVITWLYKAEVLKKLDTLWNFDQLDEFGVHLNDHSHLFGVILLGNIFTKTRADKYFLNQL